MENFIFKKQLTNILKKIPGDGKNVIVFKGLPLTAIIPKMGNIDVEKILDNKLKYFFTIQENRNFITYEEYLLLNSFILDQYENIYIINNNLYMNQLPIYMNYSDEIKRGLLVHFSDTEDAYSESFIGKSYIQEIIDLYDGVKEFHDSLIGVYFEEKAKKDPKVHVINLFDEQTYEVPVIEDTQNNKELFVDIQSELDYLELVRKIQDNVHQIYIRIDDFDGDKIQLKQHISMLAAYWSIYTQIYFLRLPITENKFEHRNDYNRILKQYWGYDHFRNFDVYDLKQLDKGMKITRKISQEQVISNIVQQVEACGDPEAEYSDIFVTAPTGSGKSVMFQIPAIYLAEKYNLLTIVISPLIGLMNDQVNGLEKRHYKYAKTINSNISPIVKEDILHEVAEGKLHILYISPETLLARSDVEQLIGNRTIGMIVIDEAHIVTTWGKQFRPDYWYLGDHISKLRRNQIKRKGRSFVIPTFTATAIYHGIEDMYEETKNSLHMINPITYLGYVKRKDITIRIERKQYEKGERREYETEKIEMLENVIKRALITGKKTLIYFPTVALIERCYEFLENKNMVQFVTKYYGPLPKDEKNENYRMFLVGEKLIMFATKAFGMGIDIDDIELVVHYAPTGNVCDYVQEIGRAARRNNLLGEAYYQYNIHDFKYINRLYGLSSIKKYQLVEVIKKIIELYKINRRNFHGQRLTRKANAMLVDAENFTYIFDNPISDADNNINRVKTALLIIQKDFEAKNGFSPINVRPIPLFAIGYFSVKTQTQNMLNEKYKGCCEEIFHKQNICRINLEKIWTNGYRDKSFPEFKYLLYSKNKNLDFVKKYTVIPALSVTINFYDKHLTKFNDIWNCLKQIINRCVVSQEYLSDKMLINEIQKKQKCIKKYKAQTIFEIVIASMEIYRRNFQKGIGVIFQKKELKSGEIKYRFNTVANTYFVWVKNEFQDILKNMTDNKFYIIDSTGKKGKAYLTVLGILDGLDILTFETIGGANTQLYIYVNQLRHLINIENNPTDYTNQLLNTVAERHLLSVQMLMYIYESDFNSNQIWNIIEDYFLGIIPENVKNRCKKINCNMVFE